MSTGLRPPGVLTWKNGFYNGEVKTRKIISSTTTELTADDLVLQRSEQLRELYQSLLSGKADHRAKRPAASLSPEDLGEAEWYYTLSMTYAFRPGQGLPGKSFASNQHVWLYNAQYADTKTFQRALLAKVSYIFISSYVYIFRPLTNIMMLVHATGRLNQTAPIQVCAF
ncbi:unnamed protein product [Triticum turgidum subsp. durum]|uniref:Transcription factor MYC/MYB N-terminal domain-containing protein n=1 Tax=Triticum turgidum subsp. durum TaxID=4567 RepID=A0A9R0U4R4_TRITD|nr:unnamed protein product [Triticum turgidum subsp. durum]